jgi:nitroreductase
MELLEAIRTRRSIRQYTSQPITEEQIHAILEAAMMAPSAGNAQTWQFIVITDRALLDEIPNIHAYAAMSREAQAGLLVCGDLELEKYPGNWIADCSAAAQNAVLAIHGLGLGGVWTEVYPDSARVDSFQKLFGLPQHVVPLAFIPFGYPAVTPSQPERYKEERVHRNRF